MARITRDMIATHGACHSGLGVFRAAVPSGSTKVTEKRAQKLAAEHPRIDWWWLGCTLLTGDRKETFFGEYDKIDATFVYAVADFRVEMNKEDDERYRNFKRLHDAVSGDEAMTALYWLNERAYSDIMDRYRAVVAPFDLKRRLARASLFARLFNEEYDD